MPTSGPRRIGHSISGLRLLSTPSEIAFDRPSWEGTISTTFCRRRARHRGWDSPVKRSRGIKQMKAVPGRMEKVDAGSPSACWSINAHTEGSLRSPAGSGSGNDRPARDHGLRVRRRPRPRKRRRWRRGDQPSDLVIVTSDNPRTENRVATFGEIEIRNDRRIEWRILEPQSRGRCAVRIDQEPPTP